MSIRTRGEKLAKDDSLSSLTDEFRRLLATGNVRRVLDSVICYARTETEGEDANREIRDLLASSVRDRHEVPGEMEIML